MVDYRVSFRERDVFGGIARSMGESKIRGSWQCKIAIDKATADGVLAIDDNVEDAGDVLPRLLPEEG